MRNNGKPNRGRWSAAGRSILALAVAAAVHSGASAGETLDSVTKMMGRSISQHLENANQNRVFVDSFKGPRSSGTHGQVRRQLGSSLKNHSITVVDEDGLLEEECWVIDGNVVIMDAGQQKLAKITADLRDENNQTDHSFDSPFYVVDNSRDVAMLTGATFDASDKHASPRKAKEVAERLSKAIDHPQVNVNADGVVRATASSPYGIELLVNEGLEFPPSLKQYHAAPDRVIKSAYGSSGKELAKADLHAGEAYAIKIHNDDAKYDVAVELYIDGVNALEFSEVAAYRENGHWIIGRDGTGSVYGWHRTDEFLEAFEIAHLPETAVASLKRSTKKVGTIQAIFFQAWKEGETPPASDSTKGGGASDALGTKRGDRLNVKSERVRRYVSETPIASVTIRYAADTSDLPPELSAY